MDKLGSAHFDISGVQPLTPPSPEPARGRPLGSCRRRSLTAAIVTAIAFLALCHSIRKCGLPSSHKPLHLLPYYSSQNDSQHENPFNWADISPSRTLTWHPCYTTPSNPSGLDCARLDIPLDWLAPSESHRVILAIVRLRATSQPSRGPIIFNPGGPGGSGIWSLRDHGRDLQTIVGEDYDIVSFDPRGVGASVPRVECWGSQMDRMFWEMQASAEVLDAHEGAVYGAFARAAALSRVCEAAQGGEEGILRHVGTTYHARDMIEVWEQMVGKEGGGLRYWGFSYGTVLGGTFAAMYPDKVERMVCDGNVDLNEWYQRVDYVNFVRDTDKVMGAFYFFCHQAGPLRCGFWAETPAKVRERLEHLLAQLRITPIIIPSSTGEPGTSLPELVTYSHVIRMLATALYQPIYRFQRVASVLAALEAGDGRPYQAYTSLDQPSSPFPFCPTEDTTPSPPADAEEGTPDSFAAILCTDGEPFTHTPTSYLTYTRSILNLSIVVGGEQATTRVSCAGRTVRSKWRFAGPFEGNTSFPILFVNNVADNVTPLVSARNNSAGFPGSVVLVQNSYGHTSLAAASRCTAGWVRGYFREGKMPGAGTVCEGDGVPFGDSGVGYGEEGPVEGVEADGIGRALRRLEGEGWGLGFGL
ncbi:TAP-like protein-domain-containing protein [Podospora aff. communis PSN243]|uniref:TAP-like protein-domain-containing protein n=1 Tax=Podospora aff. communis PSN243 TaxID=3040156 RepID=A0AAV9GSS4_9PEZI|nr:TAP-like protein-domain-containing protein [Podospora aff. communis PSN243]